MALRKNHAASDPVKSPNFIQWVQRRLRRVLFLWGQILLDQYRFKEALKCLEQSKELGMHRESVMLRIVAAHIGLGNLEIAIDLLNSIVEKTPNDIDLYVLRAKLYQTLGSHDFMNLDLQRALMLNPSHPELLALIEHVMKIATTYKNKASEQIKQNQIDVAIYFLNQALELDPLDWNSQFRRGTMFLNLGHCESAITDFMACLEQPDRDKARDIEVKAHLAGAYNKMGIQKYSEGDFLVASELFTTAIANNPSEHLFFKNRADCYMQLSALEDAKDDFMESLNLNPTHPESKQSLSRVLLNLGKQKRALGAYPKALKDFNQLVELSSNDATAYFERARTLMLMGDIDGARSDLRVSIAIDPENAECASVLASLTSGPPLHSLKPFPAQKRIVSQKNWGNGAIERMWSELDKKKGEEEEKEEDGEDDVEQEEKER